MKLGFNVKRPKGTTKSYSVIPYKRRPDGTKEYLDKLEDDGLEALNKALKSGLMTLQEAELQFKHTILPRLKNQHAVLDRVLIENLISDKNMQVFKKLWEDEYADKRHGIKGGPSWQDFMRSLRAIEPLSIVSASKSELQKKLNASFKGSKHKKIGIRINKLLKYLGRGFILNLDPVDIPVVTYLTWDEFLEIRDNIFAYKNKHQIHEEKTKDIRALCTFLFGSGCRYGEAFPLKKDDLKGDHTIFINKQVKRDGDLGRVKNRKDHKTLLINEPKVLEAFEHWTSIDKEPYRNSTLPLKSFQRAVRNTLKSKEKHGVTIHDLRHSYSAHMLGLGISLKLVSNWLGDKLSTCEMYYAGFISSDAEIEFAKSVMEEGRKRMQQSRR